MARRNLPLLSAGAAVIASIAIVTLNNVNDSDHRLSVHDYHFDYHFSSPILSGSARRMLKRVHKLNKKQRDLEEKAKAAGKTIEE
jgi:hypothetical protein